MRPGVVDGSYARARGQGWIKDGGSDQAFVWVEWVRGILLPVLTLRPELV